MSDQVLQNRSFGTCSHDVSSNHVYAVSFLCAVWGGIEKRELCIAQKGECQRDRVKFWWLAEARMSPLRRGFFSIVQDQRGVYIQKFPTNWVGNGDMQNRSMTQDGENFSAEVNFLGIG